MFRLATSGRRGNTRVSSVARRGSALVGTVVVLVGLLGLLYASSAMSVIEVKESRHAVDKVRAKYLADAGIENAMHLATQSIANASTNDPLHGLTALFGAGSSFTPFVAAPVMNGTRKVGAYTATVNLVSQTATSVTI